MQDVPETLRRQLREYDQEHVLIGWERLDDATRTELVLQLQSLDLAELRRLYDQRDAAYVAPAPERIEPAPVVRLGGDEREARARGEEALRRGQVAALIVAGGQGSRLGFEHPKGMYPIGPVSGASLFQILAEKVLAVCRRYGKPLPLLVMTSHATHEETVAYFRERDYFGLPAEEVSFFQQGTMPALDLATGRLLLEAPGRLFLSPDGHGGTLSALARSGLLDAVAWRGIRHIFYFQVDNPFIKFADPVFLGHHLAAEAEMSLKIVAKEGPADKMGNVVLIDGRPGIIEYSDLPESLGHQRDEEGRLRIWAGSPAIHWFAIDFLGCTMWRRTGLPFHIARKKVPHVDETGRRIEPTAENALKFERFIFDVLPLAKRWCVVETPRQEEFVPLKNASGADSPPVVQQALSDLAADWLARVGVDVPRRADGTAAVPLEVSPLFALDAEEFAAKVDRSTVVDGPRYWQ